MKIDIQCKMFIENDVIFMVNRNAKMLKDINEMIKQKKIKENI